MIQSAPEPDLSALRTVFNSRRRASGLTFDELAEASGVSRRTLLNISSGTFHGDLRTWLVLAQVWEVSLDELFDAVWNQT